MPDEEREFTNLVTRGFENMGTQLRDRDKELSKELSRLSENFIRMEGDLKSVTAVVSRIDADVAKAEYAQIKAQCIHMDSTIKELKEENRSNAGWIRGLMVSVILLLIGLIFNFVMARLK